MITLLSTITMVSVLLFKNEYLKKGQLKLNVKEFTFSDIYFMFTNIFLYVHINNAFSKFFSLLNFPSSLIEMAIFYVLAVSLYSANVINPVTQRTHDCNHCHVFRYMINMTSLNVDLFVLKL